MAFTKVTWIYLWIGIKRKPTTYLEQIQVRWVTVELDLLLLSEIFTFHVVLQYWTCAIRFYVVTIMVCCHSMFELDTCTSKEILAYTTTSFLRWLHASFFFSITRQSMFWKIKYEPPSMKQQERLNDLIMCIWAVLFLKAI